LNNKERIAEKDFVAERLKMRQNTSKAKAFTLIELLVVIAIIALLLSIIMPALGLAKEHAKKITCSANLRSLSMAALLYGEEHDGWAPASSNVWQDPSAGNALRAGWCGKTGDNSGPYSEERQMNGDSGSTLLGLVNGQLWPYIESFDAWRCPGEPYKDQLRSYCMASEWRGQSYLNGSVKYDGGTPKAKAYQKFSELKNTGSRFLFIDATGYNYDAYFAVFYTQENWYNIPGVWHRGGTVNGFADGHVESYKFGSETIEGAKNSLEACKTAIDSGGASSFKWVTGQRWNSEDLVYYQRSIWGGLGYVPSP
jgi:prepilin-type N-terminal cleavage/methylation domain-containing protein/prepilin-type processing-associated H-X9-DG protein